MESLTPLRGSKVSEIFHSLWRRESVYNCAALKEKDFLVHGGSVMRQFIFIITLASLIGSTARAQTSTDVPQFRFRTIDFPEGTATQAFGINERGDVVGEYTDAAGNVHGFLWSNGNFSSIDYPGAALTSTRGINDAGEIVGAFSTAGDLDHAHGYTLQNGIYTQHDFPGSPDTDILGIDESGDITGSFGRKNQTEAGYLTNRGRYNSFVVPGSAANSTGPHGINDNLQVVGFYTDAVNSAVSHGFLKKGEQFTTIDYPDANTTGLFGINEHGEIVGSCNCIDGSGHSFMFANGTFTVITYPVANSFTKARGINDRQQIVGFYQSGKTGAQHGFIATPRR
jgi:probable HAF family extracellular repeat protein